MHRRKSVASSVFGFLYLCWHLGTLAGTAMAAPERIECDLLVVGGTESGWAAALQSARLGVEKIVIVHDGVWLGGQFTEQGLACVDENKGMDKVGWGVAWHPMKRAFHRSGLFKELMDRIEAHNVKAYGSRMPGLPYHGPSTFRPAEAQAVFHKMLEPHLTSGRVRLLTNHYPVKAIVDHSSVRPRLTGLRFAKVGETNPALTVHATLTIDASDWGEAIQTAGAAFECGPDPPSRYGEPSAPRNAPPNEMNPITWAMIVEETNGESPISKPPRFDDRNYPRATHLSLAEFRGLKWDVKAPLGAIPHWPDAGTESRRQLTVYTVRRIVDGYTSKDRKTAILLNYMNGQDYALERLPKHVAEALEKTEAGASTKNIVTMTRRQREIIFQDAKRHALGVLYHLQNFVHNRANDKTNSFRRFQLSNEFGTPDKLPPKPYIRESLRLKAMYVIREQDGRNRDGLTKDKARPRFSKIMYPDGLFAWQFHYDFHRTGRTFLKQEGSSGPWIDYHKPNRHTKFLSDRCVFPLRSLIPESMDGLLGAQGNVGFSSIVSAAVRLHDQRIHIGQAAGAAAVVSLRTDVQPREIPYDREKLEAVRHALCGEVDEASPLLIWPFRDLEPSHSAFVAINRLAALRVLPLPSRDVDFRTDEPTEKAWATELLRRSHLDDEVPVDLTISRGAFCVRVWRAVRQRGWKPFELRRLSQADADGDGIRDLDDALPFTPNQPIRFQIERPQLPADRDGVPGPASATLFRSFDFCGPRVKPARSFQADRGQTFDSARGFGWSRNLTANHRKRNVLEGPQDSFIFTRSRDRWECQVPGGRYRVTLCVGDSAHEQLQQSVRVEGTNVITRRTTPDGEFAEAVVDVDVQDGRLTIDIGSGRDRSNTCLNWLRIEEASGNE